MRTNLTKPLLRLAALLSLPVAVALSVAAGVEQSSQTFTASTNTSLTAVGTLAASGGADYGTLRRLVIGLPAGLTNLNFALVDKDGTTLISTNGLAAATNAAATVTITSGAGVLPYYAPTVQMGGAMRVATNGSLAVTLTITKDR